MKRIFAAMMVVVLFVALMTSTCYATEDYPEAQVVEGTTGDALAGDEDVISQDWLTDLRDSIRENKDDIAALCIVLAGALFEAGLIYFKKKVWPQIESFVKKQSENAMEMAKASGKITQKNKEQFEEVLAEVKSILAEGSERESILLKAMETETKTKDEYKALCEKMFVYLNTVATAMAAQEQMTYETLMSAKLTDVRKEEIEKQHLQNKALLLAALNPVSEVVNKDETVEA